MRKQKGFTLIELLVVIAIIGLLSTLAIVALNTARQRSRDAIRLSDVKQIQTALELHFADQGAYPAQDPAVSYLALGLDTATNDAICFGSSAFDDDCSGHTSSYMATVPRDPSMSGAPATPTYCTASLAAPCEYAYANQATGVLTAYRIYFSLEGAAGGLAAGAHVATLDGIQ